MKRILLVFILLFGYGSVYSQVYVKESSVDEFTGTKTIMTNMFTLTKGNMVKAVVGNLDGMCVLSFATMTDLGCGGAKGNYIIFLFEDGSTINYGEDIAKIDCSVYSECRYILEPNDFVGKKVTKMRIRKTEKRHDYEWKEVQNMTDILQLVGFDTMVEMGEPIIDSTQVEVISK